MGFGHRVYRAYDPRAAALREVAEQMSSIADWLELAVAVEDVALRVGVVAEDPGGRHAERSARGFDFQSIHDGRTQIVFCPCLQRTDQNRYAGAGGKDRETQPTAPDRGGVG